MLKKAISLMIALGLTVALAPAVSAAAANTVSMTVSVGYGGNYVVGETTPVVVTIKNSGKEIDGTIELLTGVGFDMLVSRDVVLPQNSEKQFVLFVQASAIYKPQDFEVTLKSGGVTAVSAVPQTVTGIDPSLALCGILSDDPAAVSYMKKIVFSQSAIKDWEELTQDQIYENADLLESFDLLVINDFDTGKLTDGQRSAIMQWVYSGGTLIIGTGPGHENAANPFNASLSGLSIGGSTTASNLTSLTPLAQGKAFQGSLPVLSITGNGWTADAATDGGSPLLLHRGFGKGFVFVASYDLGEGTMGSWAGNSLLWQTLIERNTSINQGKYSPNYYMGYGSGSQAMSTALKAGLGGGSLTFWFFILLLLIFIALSGFIGYAVLRKLGRQKWMWVAIPVLAALFSLLLLLCGRVSFGRKPYMFAYTATDISGGVAMSDRQLAFIAPAMGNYMVAVDVPGLIFPEENNSLNYDIQSQTNIAVKLPVSSIVNADSAGLKFLNVNLDGSRIATFKTVSRQAPLEFSFEYDGSAVNCTVKNVSDSTVEGVNVVIGNSYKTVGDMAAGAEQQVSLPLDQTPIDQGLWSVIEQIYPNNGAGFISGFGKTDREQEIRSAIMNDEINNFMGNTATATGVTTVSNVLGQAYCFGWVSKPFEYGVKVNGQTVKPVSLELITALVPITQKSLGGKQIQIVKAFGQLNTTQTPANGASMNGNDITVNSGQVAVLDFNLTGQATLALSDLYFEAGEQQGMSSGSWSIYDWSTAAWDPVATKQHYAQADMGRYINPDGLVRIRVTIGSQDYLDAVPFVWVQGVSK